ncbi:DUF6894 family protein [Limoniibacter endophyticus]|uniref:DUF6894 domain-containing protein n=1 Tax=Limoniibacter endophyticus TaxID=1565040 RepID=A0A8J3GGJ2_9HYPH|nr:hypothetical protein GCM10010136_07810 [Limoniibacter endophyticus]
MSRYFFDLYKGETFTLDEEGQNVPSEQRIRRESLKLLSDLFRDEAPDEENGAVYCVKVRDETGHYIFEARCILKSFWSDEATNG